MSTVARFYFCHYCTDLTSLKNCYSSKMIGWYRIQALFSCFLCYKLFVPRINSRRRIHVKNLTSIQILTIYLYKFKTIFYNKLKLEQLLVTPNWKFCQLYLQLSHTFTCTYHLSNLKINRGSFQAR